MSAETNRRATLVDEISERTGITDAMIAVLVGTFYGRVRQDPLLAPIFAKVANWDEHLAKLRDFWSSVVLISGRYHGQPMEAHFPLSIEPQHFDPGWRCSSRPLPTSARRPQRYCSWRRPGGSPTASRWRLPPKAAESRPPATRKKRQTRNGAPHETGNNIPSDRR